LSLASSFIVVNSFTDVKAANDGLCTLREAVIAANKDKPSGTRAGECPAGHGADTIILPAGNYQLTRTDNGNEDASQTGDLDISGSLTIQGAGASVTTVTAEAITDRVIHALVGNITISGVTLQQGHVSGKGGALLSQANLTLHDVALLNSEASLDGGGLAVVHGTLSATAVTIAHNTSQGKGGGVAVRDGAATFTNSTISGNTAVLGGSALAVWEDTVLHFVTVVGDTAVYHDDLTVDSTILAGACTGHIVSVGHNLLQTAGCTVTGDPTGNIIGVDAELEPLAANDGSTQTHALAPDSPALDAGNSETCPPTDQRGVGRPRGSACDIGAYEVEVTPP